MKILEENFTKGGGGFVKLVPDNAEDMWQLYNLLRVDDHVEATTFRKVSREGAGGVGASESERVRVKLRLHVEAIEYDGDGEAIRVKGRNTTETEHVKLGAYHTLDMDVSRAVKVEKTEWDAVVGEGARGGFGRGEGRELGHAHLPRYVYTISLTPREDHRVLHAL